jgi:hypothetical protein
MSNPETIALTDTIKPATDTADATPTDLKATNDPPVDEDTKSDDAEPEEEDEEDNLFTSIETSEQALGKAEQASGHDAAAAPTLLKDAITKGEVDVDESEAEEEKGEGLGEEKKGEEHHVHHRVSLYLGIVDCLSLLCCMLLLLLL